MTSCRIAATVVLALGATRLIGALGIAGIAAQPTSRLAILAAEDRRAPTAHDVTTIRAGLRSRDLDTARVAVRAMGRLERPDVIPDILPLLKSALPEIRAEAANAVAQAAQGWKQTPAVRTAAVEKQACRKWRRRPSASMP